LGGGASVRAAAADVGLSKSQLHRLAQAYHLPRRAVQLTDEQRGTAERLIREGKLSGVQISRQVGCAPSTICVLRRQFLDAQARVRFRPRRLKTPQTCERGHQTYFDPCVICAGLAGRRP
jgi:transposase-like protein